MINFGIINHENGRKTKCMYMIIKITDMLFVMVCNELCRISGKTDFLYHDHFSTSRKEGKVIRDLLKWKD